MYSNKIVVLYPFYGKLPWYFKFFLHSCRFNPLVDFFIFTDIKIKEKMPNNVFVHFLTFASLKEIACTKLGFPISLNTPYKLCDFKPAYGFIFSEYIKNYAFWGHGDIDLIFGNIKNFITDEILTEFDVICVKDEYVTGFFTLFRNNTYINTLFKQSKDYMKVFQNPKNCIFDECSNLFSELKSGKSIFELDCEIETMTHVVKKLALNNKIKAHFDLFAIEGIPGELYWDNGVLSYKDKYEAMLYHFISFKIFPHYTPFFWRNLPLSFYVHKNYISKFSKKTLLGKINAFFITIYLKFRTFIIFFILKIKNIKLLLFFLFNRRSHKMVNLKVVIDNKKIIRNKKIEKLIKQ